ERTVNFSTGFIEVKPDKNRSNTQRTHEDSIRLANFCKNAQEKKNLKSVIAIQAVSMYQFTISFI
ncbi:hypothetical protein EDC94DRAFT_499322, partial [Helicostylum pulchrum]